MRHLAAALLVLSTLAAPHAAAASGWCLGSSGPRGNGNKVTQQRQVGAFTQVRLEGSLDVRVQAGAPTSVAVTIDENLQDQVETRLEGDTLVIASRGMSYRGPGEVAVALPVLRGLAIDGSGGASVEGGQGDLALSLAGSGDLAWRGEAGKLEVALRGSGDVTLAGTAESASIAIKGSGDVRARGLTARSADVTVSGSGDVALTLAGGTFRAEVNGSGDVDWYGSAQVERTLVRGSGDISQH